VWLVVGKQLIPIINIALLKRRFRVMFPSLSSALSTGNTSASCTSHSQPLPLTAALHFLFFRALPAVLTQLLIRPEQASDLVYGWSETWGHQAASFCCCGALTGAGKPSLNGTPFSNGLILSAPQILRHDLTTRHAYTIGFYSLRRSQNNLPYVEPKRRKKPAKGAAIGKNSEPKHFLKSLLLIFMPEYLLSK
jgi:hypothetical protein